MSKIIKAYGHEFVFTGEYFWYESGSGVAPHTEGYPIYKCRICEVEGPSLDDVGRRNICEKEWQEIKRRIDEGLPWIHLTEIPENEEEWKERMEDIGLDYEE